MFVRSRQQRVCRKLEILIKLHFTVLHIVHLGTHLIHAIRRVDSHHVVYPRTAERPIHQVDGFIAPVSEEKL